MAQADAFDFHEDIFWSRRLLFFLANDESLFWTPKESGFHFGLFALLGING